MIARIEAGDIDDDPLVRAAADRLLFVAGLDPKRERASLDGGQFGRGVGAHSDRRGREVADVEVNAEALMPGGQQMLDRRERRRFDQIDHDRGGEHRHQPAADAGRGVFDADQQVRRSRQPDLER